MWGATVNGLRVTQRWSHPVQVCDDGSWSDRWKISLIQADIEAAVKILEQTLFAEMRRLANPEELSRYTSFWSQSQVSR